MAGRGNPERSGPSQGRLRRNAVAGVLGDVMEWYNFAIYGYLAPIPGDLFFPSDDALAASLIGAFGAFAAGFVARPLGGIMFGHIGDRYGRKLVLTTSVLLMGLGPSLSACCPTRLKSAASRP